MFMFDNLGEFVTYNWGQAVYDYLLACINQSLGHILRGAETASGKMFIMPGCVAALLIWLYEHILTISPTANLKRYPRLFRYTNSVLPKSIAEADKRLNVKESEVIF
jgi:hypothetical protein